jgi:hypothetical protein
MYVYVLDLRGGAPPVMDGIVPEHGPDVETASSAWIVHHVICWTRLVCLSKAEVFQHCWSNW